MDPIDNVSRDSKDGTYRCPQCQTPFTRRSNLRRHFQIHLRDSALKSEVFNEDSHSTKDNLQDHVATSQSPTWNVSHEKPYQRMPVIPQDITSANPHSPFANVSPSSYGPFSSPSMGQYPNLASPAPSRAFQVPNFGRLSLSTAGSSSSESAAIPRPASSMTSGRRTAIIESSSRPNPFPYRRSNTSSSSIISPSIAPASPYIQMGQPAPLQGHYGPYPPSEAPPLSTHQEWLAEIMEQQGLDSGDERPIYTRQQVKNMLEVVSDCFIESIESVLNANGQRPPNPARSNNHSTTLDPGVRQMILTEVIPRLVSRLQGNDGVNAQAADIRHWIQYGS